MGITLAYNKLCKDIKDEIAQCRQYEKTYLTSEKELERVVALIHTNETLFDTFTGVDKDISKKIDTSRDISNVNIKWIKGVVDGLQVHQEKLYKASALLTSDVIVAAPDIFEKEKICQEARRVIDRCRNQMTESQLQMMDAQLDKTIADLQNLEKKINEYNNGLNTSIRNIERNLKELDGYADRYNCKEILSSVRKDLQNLDKGDEAQALKKLERLRTKLINLKRKFADEADMARKIYRETLNSKTYIWEDSFEVFFSKWAFVETDSVRSRSDFDVEKFKEIAKRLKTEKEEDILAYIEDNKKLMIRNDGYYAKRLNNEIVQAAVSREAFEIWKRRIKEEIAAARREKWLKVWGVTKIVLKVLCYIIFGIFVIGWLMIQFIFSLISNSSDDDD